MYVCAKRVYVKALSKYQFETATTVGMRHAFHRPLRPAFHFYLYLPGGVGPSCRRIPMSPGHPAVRDRKGVSRRCALFIFYDILFPIRSRSAQEGITWHLGPYSTFMALNRDEVSREWTNLATNSLLFLSLSPFFLFISSDSNLRRIHLEGQKREFHRSWSS